MSKDWLKDLNELSDVSDIENGLTTSEMVAQTGHTVLWIRKRLHEAKKRGRLVVGRKSINRLDGSDVFLPAYRVVPDGEK